MNLLVVIDYMSKLHIMFKYIINKCYRLEDKSDSGICLTCR